MIVTLEYLEELRKNTKGKIVLATGTFDLFHYEHLMYLEAAKKLGDVLVVAVKDNACARFKGPNRPFMDEEYRIAIVDAIRYVDYSVLVHFDDTAHPKIVYDNESQRQWLVMFEPVFELLKPDILYHEINPVLDDARTRVFDAYGITGVSTVRLERVSTSKIVAKISKSISA